MIVIFLLISLVFLMALVVAPLSVIAVSLAIWGRRNQPASPDGADLAPAAAAPGHRPS